MADHVEIPVAWVGADDVPVAFVNQFVAQVDRGEVFLTCGQLVPPALAGSTEEERKAALESIQFVSVKPIARLGMTPDRLRELVQVLTITLENHEKQQEAFGDPR